MSQRDFVETLTKIREQHDSLEKKVERHRTFFETGNRLIAELERQQRSGYVNDTKYDVLVYIDQILVELYHIGGNGRGPFREHFREHVVMDDIGRFREQNVYLKDWVDFAESIGVVGGSLTKSLRNAIVTLNDLYNFVRKNKEVKPGSITRKANSAFNELYSLREGNDSLGSYALQHFHIRK